MAELKTKVNDRSVVDFLKGVPDEVKRQDSFTVLEIMRQATGEEAKMWGDSMVGFGSYHYRYASGQGGDWPLVGFSPRKQNLTLYIMPGFDRYSELLQRLGKFTTGKSCLYVKKLADIDQAVLKELVRQSVEHMRNSHAD